MNPTLEHEFDEDYILARRLQREEEALRRQEEEKNQLALKRFLAEEERAERRRRQSQLEESQMAALKLQTQWNREQREQDNNEESELVDYKTLLQQQKEDEESLQLAMKLQAEEEERERHKRERQKHQDERFAAQMMLMQEETIQETSVPAVASVPDLSTLDDDNDDHRIALKVEKEHRMKMIVSQMFKEHAKFERIAKRRKSRRMTVAGFETPTSLVFATSS